MAREFVMIVQESAFCQPIASPVVWTTTTPYNTATAFYFRLDEGNSFTMRPTPQVVEVPYGGGLAIGAYRVSDKMELRGNLRTKFTTALAPFLFGWATTRIDTTQTKPWTTTEGEGDLASCAIFHAIQRSDGTYRRRVYLGCKVDSVALDISADSTVGTINMGLSASRPQGNPYDGSSDPTPQQFPPPGTGNLPYDPYLFAHTQNTLVINNTVRKNITNFNLNIANNLARNFFNQRFLGKLQFTGRDVSIGMRSEMQGTPDDRAIYEGQMPYGTTPVPMTVAFDDGLHTMSMNFNGNNVYDPLTDETSLNDLYFFSFTSNNLWDGTADTDFAFSFAAD